MDEEPPRPSQKSPVKSPVKSAAKPAKAPIPARAPKRPPQALKAEEVKVRRKVMLVFRSFESECGWWQGESFLDF